MHRRSFLTTAAGGTLLLAGCTARSDERASPDSDPSKANSPPNPSSRGLPVLTFASVVANPAGSDADDLDGEVVRLEFNVDVESFSLSGSTLLYPGGERYEFSKLVAGSVRRGATVEVHSGPGSPGTDGSAPPEYSVFAGSDAPLLPDGGGTIALENPSGATLSEVTYPALDAGEAYTVPEES
ncbi:hypothetical protein BRD18_01080 [Halobacteriales archaeon SW_7_71_33]|nr:MAG: hypothetical protein BRD18_01080 [Halobacteriales archaeon SW_7_71_33]